MNAITKAILLAIISLSCTSFLPPRLTWVAIGDSITYLNDHPNETGNRITKGYMTMVTERLPHITYINQGHNGWTAGGIADKFDQLNITKADIYSVFLGTNDWWQGREPGTMQDYLSASGNTTVSGSFRIIIDKLKHLNPNARFILMTPLQRGDFVYLNNSHNNAWGSYRPNKNGQMLEAIVRVIDSIARHEKFELIDLYHNSGINLKNMVHFKLLKDSTTGATPKLTWPAYRDKPWNPANDAYPYPPEAIWMTYDGLHPSDEGYKAITKMLVKVMKRY